MAKIKVEVLSAAECDQRSIGTDSFTEGWWYHATTYNTGKKMVEGKKKISGVFWLTKNPQGASQCNGKTVLRCKVHLKKSNPPVTGDDKYNRKDEDEGLDKPYKWIGVLEGNVFIDKDSLPESDEEETADKVPSVGDELARILNSANQAKKK